MIDFYFLSNNVLMILFVLSAAATGLQSAYAWIIAFNNLKKRLLHFVSEVFLTVYILILAMLPINSMVNRLTSVVVYDTNYAVFYAFAIVMVLCYALMIHKKGYTFIIPILCICCTLPYMIYTDMYVPIYVFSVSILLTRAFKAVIVEQRRKRTDVSAFTIKDGVDSLPAGVLFAGVDGHIYLVNTCMLELMDRYFEREEVNANSFWEKLIQGRAVLVETQLLLTTVLLRSESDTWCFMKRTFTEKNRTYVEIIATDITETDRTFLTLEAETQKLLAQNEKITVLSEKMVQLRKEQEYSRIRNQIHDVMGQRLTAIQRMLQSQKPAEYLELIPLLQNIVENIREEKSKDMSVMLLDLQLYFKKVGIYISVDGKLPIEEPIAYLFITTLREATTNASRHANATKVFAKIVENKDVYILTIENNGRKPLEKGAEGGGIRGIRNRVETNGGTLQIEWGPKFKITIEICKGIVVE